MAVQNLIQNGNFEANIGRTAPTGWHRVGSEIGQIVNDDGDNAYQFSVYMQTANAPIGQTFATVPGKTYTVDFKSGVLGGGPGMSDAGVYAILKDATGTDPLQSQIIRKDFELVSDVDQPMVDLSLTFTAVSASTTLVFGGASPIGVYAPVGIDDVSVTENTPPDNLITNGDFEASSGQNPTGWQTVGSGVSEDVGGDNAFVFNVFKGVHNSAIKQEIATEPGQTYEIKFKAGVTTGIANNPSIAVSITNGDFVTQSNAFWITKSADSPMGEYTMTFTATSDHATLMFSDTSAGQPTGFNVGIDDISVVATDVTPPEINLITGTAGDDYLVDTDASDTMLGGDGNDTFALLHAGNDTVDGEGGDYNQVDLAGSAADYTFARNADGTITVTGAATGIDTLRNIDGFWLYGEEKWYAADQLAPEAPGGTTTIIGTAGDDYLADTAANDTMLGGEGQDTFFLSRGGHDTVDGQGGDYNQIDLLGAVQDYTFVNNSDGTFTMLAGRQEEWTVELKNIDGAYFYGSRKWYAIEDIAAQGFANRVEGTPGDDYLTGTGARDIMHGGEGNDTFRASDGNDLIFGEGGSYNQVDYSGSAADYVVRAPNGGSAYVVEKADGAVDSLIDIHGLWFEGEQKWYDIDDLAVADIDVPPYPVTPDLLT